MEHAEGAYDLTYFTISVNSGTDCNCRMHYGYMTLWGKKKTPPARWFVDPTNPSRLRWWDGRAWTDHYAPISPNGPVSSTPGFPAQRVPAQVVSVPAVTPSMTTTSPVSASMDDDPSDVLRHVQSGMVSANLDLPLDEQVEVVGEQYHPKEIRKLFRECGLPITSAGATLEEEMCYLVPEPWNPHDPNAVAVMIRTYQVGHLPAELAKRYHPRLIGYAKQRQLVTGVARVWSRLESGTMVRARVTIAVPEVAVLLSRERAQVASPLIWRDFGDGLVLIAATRVGRAARCERVAWTSMLVVAAGQEPALVV